MDRPSLSKHLFLTGIKTRENRKDEISWNIYSIKQFISRYEEDIKKNKHQQKSVNVQGKQIQSSILMVDDFVFLNTHKIQQKKKKLNKKSFLFLSRERKL